jgi:glycosyltransferase involved in cell wall biosynthesis
MKHLEVSIIIRTLNEEQYIGLLLDTIKSQAFDQEQIEIIVVDSGSTDDTLKIIKNYDVQIIEMPKESFTYSKALNLGIENSRGKWIVILSAHSIPTDKNWLHGMISHFEDPQVAGVYCRQISWPNTPWDEEMRIEKTFPSESRLFFGNKAEDMNFSNVASCISREYWLRQPFVEIPAAEDRYWALWATHNNFIIKYDASISVWHSHNESPKKSAYRLIEIEKSIDICMGRKRTACLTLQNAIGMLLKDSKKIIQYDGCKSKRLISIYNSFCRAFWFVVDFK